MLPDKHLPVAMAPPSEIEQGHMIRCGQALVALGAVLKMHPRPEQWVQSVVQPILTVIYHGEQLRGVVDYVRRSHYMTVRLVLRTLSPGDIELVRSVLVDQLVDHLTMADLPVRTAHARACADYFCPPRPAGNLAL